MSILDIAYIPLNNWLEAKTTLANIMAMKSVKNMFLDWYETKVFFKKLAPIESLTREEKLQYWEAAKEFEDRETRIEAVKVLYVMAYMITLKNEYPKTNG